MLGGGGRGGRREGVGRDKERVILGVRVKIVNNCIINTERGQRHIFFAQKQ